jgi:hypothetical protein
MMELPLDFHNICLTKSLEPTGEGWHSSLKDQSERKIESRGSVQALYESIK